MITVTPVGDRPVNPQKALRKLVWLENQPGPRPAADRTRSRRQRAGSRRNKRHRSVGTFESDHRASTRDRDRVWGPTIQIATWRA